MIRNPKLSQPPDGLAGGFSLPEAGGHLKKFIASNFPRFAWLSLGLCVFTIGALWCQPVDGATNTNAVISAPLPPPRGSIPWEMNQQLIKERQESYRKHVFLPDASGNAVPRLNSLNAPDNGVNTTPRKFAPLIAPETLRALIFFAIVFALAGYLTYRKLPLHVRTKLNRRFNPWRDEPEPERVFQEKVRAEEESVARFLATFHVGPAGSTPAGLSGQADQANEFYAQAPGRLERQRKLLQAIGQEPSGQSRQKMLSNLRDEINGLKDLAGFPAVLPVWQTASALEGLVKQLTERLGNVTPSALRTVGGGVDLLNDLCVPGLQPHLLTDRPLKFLVVDDDLISRLAVALALKKAFNPPDQAADGGTALALCGQQAYDVIFLDVQMLGMDGFELCMKIRETVLNRSTPVVFVTVQNDFEARARSTVSGGNDLMGKPFLTFEITVKALTLALHGRLHGRAPMPTQNLEFNGNGTDVLPTIVEATRPLTNPVTPVRTVSAGEHKKLTQAFLKRALTHTGPLQELCRKMLLATDEESRQTLLVDGFLRINSLVSQADDGLLHPAYQMSIALDGLFRKLLENAKHSTASTLATITAAVDVLRDLCVPGLKADLASNPPIEMLVVDDDLVARRAVAGALQTAFNRPDSAENGEAAIAQAAEKPYDVIFLDVVMPGMDGFATCSKIRNTIANSSTPVIFVTGKTDAETRTAMSRSGGSDLLGKPFLTSEITVKALTFALRGRLLRLNPAAHA